MATQPNHPDAKLHPEATGAAATTVQHHSKEEPLKLYSGWFCPFVQRAWSVLEEKKIPYQYIEVNPYHKPQSLLDLNPRGLVPTLQYDNKPLYESAVICEFLEDAYPDHTPHLLPKDPYTRARTRIWTDHMTSRTIPSFHRFLQFQPMDDKEGLKKAQDEFLGNIKQFTAEMDNEGPYFLGSEPCLVDFVVAPFLNRLWVFEKYKEGTGIPEEGAGGDDEKIWARFRKWEQAMTNRDSIKNTTSERHHYFQIYQRYADNTAQSEMAKATRSGRGVP